MLMNRKGIVKTNWTLKEDVSTTLINDVYRICKKHNQQKNNGISYVLIEINNKNGLKIGFCDTEAINWYNNEPYFLVTLKGHLIKNGNYEYIRVIEINPYKKSKTIESLLSFPKELFNSQENIQRLIAIRESIQSRALGNFLDTIFSDETIALPFLQVPASIKYHHNFPGGLLEHSLEVVTTTKNQAYENDFEREIAIVAALLHDIGKVRTYLSNMKTSILGKMVSHDALTLEICAPALKELDKEWEDAANTLRHVWTCVSPGSKYGFERNCKIANIIQYADRLSADKSDAEKAFFVNEKANGFAWLGTKYYWKPRGENKSVMEFSHG